MLSCSTPSMGPRNSTDVLTKGFTSVVQSCWVEFVWTIPKLVCSKLAWVPQRCAVQTSHRKKEAMLARPFGCSEQNYRIQFTFLLLTHRITFLWVTYPFGLSLLSRWNGFSTSAPVLLVAYEGVGVQSASESGVRQYTEECACLDILSFLHSFSVLRWLLGSFPFVLCLQLLPPASALYIPEGNLWGDGCMLTSNFIMSYP